LSIASRTFGSATGSRLTSSAAAALSAMLACIFFGLVEIIEVRRLDIPLGRAMLRVLAAGFRQRKK